MRVLANTARTCSALAYWYCSSRSRINSAPMCCAMAGHGRSNMTPPCKWPSDPCLWRECFVKSNAMRPQAMSPRGQPTRNTQSSTTKSLWWYAPYSWVVVLLVWHGSKVRGQRKERADVADDGHVRVQQQHDVKVCQLPCTQLHPAQFKPEHVSIDTCAIIIVSTYRPSPT